jgi:hypothetical protein
VNGHEFKAPSIDALLSFPHAANELNDANTTQGHVIEDHRIENVDFLSVVSLFRNERILMKSPSRKTMVIV